MLGTPPSTTLMYNCSCCLTLTSVVPMSTPTYASPHPRVLESFAVPGCQICDASVHPVAEVLTRSKLHDRDEVTKPDIEAIVSHPSTVVAMEDCSEVEGDKYDMFLRWSIRRFIHPYDFRSTFTMSCTRTCHTC